MEGRSNSSDSPVISMEGISKRFPGVQALDDVDFNVAEGEIHGLLGENGAGKSTLMNILFGLYSRDQGEIRIRGESVDIRSPEQGLEMGIGMVHQLFKQVYRHTVAENIALAVEPDSFFPDAGVKDRIEELLDTYGWDIDPDASIWRLTASDQQKVEIIKVLCQGARILILDEPTSVLTPQGKEELFNNLKAMRDDGYSIVYITHKLDEVKELSDRVTILRGGEKIDTIQTETVTTDDLARKMVGREVLFQIDKDPADPGETILELDRLSVRGDRGEQAVDDVSFTVQRGEIMGMAGVGGSGQSELMEAITGLRRTDSGQIQLLGENITNVSSRRAIDAGVGYIPEERERLALVSTMAIEENLVLKSYRTPEFRNGLIIDWDRIHENALEMIEKYEVKAPGPETPIGQLSGGNLQKVLLAREIEDVPELLIAAYPTQGLDVGTIEKLRELLLEQRRQCAVLLISEDLDEIMMISDRISVMYDGQLMGTVDAEEVKKEEVGMMMLGSSKQEALS